MIKMPASLREHRVYEAHKKLSYFMFIIMQSLNLIGSYLLIYYTSYFGLLLLIAILFVRYYIIHKTKNNHFHLINFIIMDYRYKIIIPYILFQSLVLCCLLFLFPVTNIETYLNENLSDIYYVTIICFLIETIVTKLYFRFSW